MIRQKNRSMVALAYASAFALAVSAHAQRGLEAANAESGKTIAEAGKFDASLGLSWGLGKKQNSSMDLQSRTMNAFSVNALPAYRFEKFSLGLDIDYRWHGQNTGLSEAGGTNLKGQGYTLGLGARFPIDERFMVQAGLSFFGRFDFSKDTDTSENTYMMKPIGVRAKAQYFFIPSLPLSFDLDLQYLTWTQFTVSTVKYSRATQQWFVGLGLTYYFGGFDKEAPVAIVEESAPAPVTQEQLAQVADVKQTDKGLVINLAGDVTFAPNSSVLNSEAQAKVRDIAEIIVKHPTLRLRVDGHTDSSGSRANNQVLSQKRADSVKAILVENGVVESNISATGFGPDNPVATNSTVEGRAQNRRVEITIEQP